MRTGVAWSTMRIGLPSMATICVCLVGLTTPATATTAGLTSRPKTIASYCSPSGDVCYGVLNRSNHVILQITTAARYFTRYTLCVTRLPRGSGPEHARRCGSFPLFRQTGSTWGSSVNYARQFVGAARQPVRAASWSVSGQLEAGVFTLHARGTASQCRWDAVWPLAQFPVATLVGHLARRSNCAPLSSALLPASVPTA